MLDVNDGDLDGIVDRARGALLGLAVGDALGTTLEFQARDSQPLHTRMIGGGPFRLPPGVWTDDTSMALALGESLIACGFDAKDLMDRFIAWWREGTYSATGRCFDIGNVTRAALEKYEKTGDPIAGSVSEDTAGNGSLMRLAPVALYALRDEARCADLAIKQSRVTHGAPQATDACTYLAGLLRMAILGWPKDRLLQPSTWTGHTSIREVAAGAWCGKPRSAISSSGYVVHTLEAALWAIGETESFEDALILAVNLGGDADTVGAVTGQLAGAIYGASAIPADWRSSLAWEGKIVSLADALLKAGDAQNSTDTADDEAWFTEIEVEDLFRTKALNKPGPLRNTKMPSLEAIKTLTRALNEDLYFFRRKKRFWSKVMAMAMARAMNDARYKVSTLLAEKWAISEAGMKEINLNRDFSDLDNAFGAELEVAGRLDVLCQLKFDLDECLNRNSLAFEPSVYDNIANDWQTLALRTAQLFREALKSSNPDMSFWSKGPIPRLVAAAINRITERGKPLRDDTVANFLEKRQPKRPRTRVFRK